MNLRQLQAFKIVFAEESITLSARRFGITQPAMSTLIGKLEDEVGFSLFDRHKGRLKATPEANRFIVEVDQVLSGFDKVVRTARDIRTLNTGQLQIASLPGISIGFLPSVVAVFSKQHPEVKLSLQARSSTQVEEWLASQLFDIGIAELPIVHPAVDVEPLKLNCVCVVPEGHPLAKFDILTPADVAPYPFISLNPDHMTHFRLKAAFEADSVIWQPKVECQLFAPACMLVSEGVGVALVDPFTAADFKGRGIETRPFKPSIPFDIALLHPSLRPRSLIAEEFVTLLKKEIQIYLRHDDL